MKYDARKTPDSDEWLSVDEEERMALIVTHHKRIGDQLQNINAHAVMHAIVENQIALNEEAPTKTLRRLRAEGLDRHDAIHAVGSVLANQIFDMLSQQPPGDYDGDRYSQELSKLTAKKWRKLNRNVG